MRKYYFILLIISVGVFLTSCEQDSLIKTSELKSESNIIFDVIELDSLGRQMNTSRSILLPRPGDCDSYSIQTDCCYLNIYQVTDPWIQLLGGVFMAQSRYCGDEVAQNYFEFYSRPNSQSFWTQHSAESYGEPFGCFSLGSSGYSSADVSLIDGYHYRVVGKIRFPELAYEIWLPPNKVIDGYWRTVIPECTTTYYEFVH